MTPYNAKDWYWHVGGDATRAYSSALGDYVSADNATFLAWKNAGGVPTKIDTEGNLGEALAQHLARPTQATVLDGYRGSQAKEIVQKIDFKMLLNHENRLRAIERALNLNGNPANVTAPQALNVIKGLM